MATEKKKIENGKEKTEKRKKIKKNNDLDI